jgi:hypothetical protein
MKSELEMKLEDLRSEVEDYLAAVEEVCQGMVDSLANAREALVG